MGLALIITFAITFLFNISCHKESSNEVIIGGLFGITGTWPTLGNNSRAALEIAIEDINEYYKGNEKNVKFASSVKDTELEPDLALELLEEFFDSGIKLVIGPMSSAEVWAIKYFADSNDIIIVSQSSTAGPLSIAGDNIFRFAPDDDLEGEAIAALLDHDRIQSIIPIFRDDAGNKGVIDATKRHFVNAGGMVVEGFPYDIDDVDFPAEIVRELSVLVAEQLAADNATIAVLLAGFDEVVQIFNEATKGTYDDTLGAVKWYGTDGIVFSQALLDDEEASEFAQNENVSYPSATLGLDDNERDDIWGPIADEITEKTGIIPPDAFALSVYDIAWTLAEAYLNTEDPKDLETFKNQFIVAAAELPAITGSTELNEAGDRKSADFDFWGIREENEVVIWKKVEFFDAETKMIAVPDEMDEN